MILLGVSDDERFINGFTYLMYNKSMNYENGWRKIVYLILYADFCKKKIPRPYRTGLKSVKSVFIFVVLVFKVNWGIGFVSVVNICRQTERTGTLNRVKSCQIPGKCK